MQEQEDVKHSLPGLMRLTHLAEASRHHQRACHWTQK